MKGIKKTRKTKWKIFITRGNHPLSVGSFSYHGTKKGAHDFGLPPLTTYKIGTGSSYVGTDNLQKIITALQKIVVKDPDRLLRVFEKEIKNLKRDALFTSKYRSINWSRTTDQDLHAELQVFLRKFLDAFRLVYYPLWIQKVVETVLEQDFRTYESKESKHIIETFSKPLYTIERENFYHKILSLACNQKRGAITKGKINGRICNLVNHYRHLPTYIWHIRMHTVASVTKEVNQYIKKNPCLLLHQEQLAMREQTKARKRIFAHYHKIAIKQRLTLLSMAAYFREERIFLWGRMTTNALPLITEVCNRHKITLKDFTNLTVGEMKTMQLSPLEVRQRSSKGYLYTVHDDAVTIKSLKRRIFSDDKNNPTLLRGKTAFAGEKNIRGRVRIVSAYTFHTLRKGEIMVTGMTTPNAVSHVRRATAIITDEGGITCHAAIISRELKIPCIIGTKVATKVLKDGMIVEVDANKGIVKILKR